jgi:hypothetical protein
MGKEMERRAMFAQNALEVFVLVVDFAQFLWFRKYALF